MSTDTIKINVPVLARVEGEGALDLTIENKRITDLELRIYEPPRYFEKFLEGRNYYDVPDIVARICGICPVAYQMSATHAIESIFNVRITPWIRAMRRLFYCGEWLQSHSLHIHLLAAPDFLGFNNVIEMSSTYRNEVKRGLKLQALGNDLISLFGARSVHPVGVKIGGFTKAPDKKNINVLLERIIDAKQDAIDLIHWLDTLDLPVDNQDFTSVALHHDNEYPCNEGRLISSDGLDISIDEFEKYFKEHHADQSTALHCLLQGKPYLVGPLARVNLNSEQLPDQVKQIMQEIKTRFPSKNMFHSIIARAIEIYFVILEAERLLSNYEATSQPRMDVIHKAGTGYGCTEAPRGLLWHRYDIDEKGCITKAIIVPPTSQNQPRIEQDLKESLVNFGLDNTKEKLQLHAEKVIRNYDPCISCATHFLNLNLVRDNVLAHNDQKTLITGFANIDVTKTVIIGIGSPNKNDDNGWRIIDALNNRKIIHTLKKKGLCLYKLDRPGIKLNEIIKPFTSVIIIDAANSNNDEQKLVWIKSGDINTIPSSISSHDIKLPETLKLMHAIKTLPDKTIILGIHGYSESLEKEACNEVEKLLYGN